MKLASAHSDHLQPNEPDHGLARFSEAIMEKIKNCGGQIAVDGVLVLDLVKRENLIVRADVHQGATVECECTVDELDENAVSQVAERLLNAIHAATQLLPSSQQCQTEQKTMKEHYKVQCICQKCGRTQATQITHLMSGGKCRVVSLKHPTCDGALSLHSQDCETATYNALAMLGYINSANVAQGQLAEWIDAAVDDAGQWMDNAKCDPVSMGWVSQSGLP